MRELQGIQAYAVVSKQMMLKEGQVFVKANATKTRGGALEKHRKKNKAKVKQKAKVKSESIPESGRFRAAQKRKDVAK